MRPPPIRPDLLRKLEEALRADAMFARALRAAPIQTLRTVGTLSADEVQELAGADVAAAVDALCEARRPPRYEIVRRALIDALEPLRAGVAWGGTCAPCAEGDPSSLVPAGVSTASHPLSPSAPSAVIAQPPAVTSSGGAELAPGAPAATSSTAAHPFATTGSTAAVPLAPSSSTAAHPLATSSTAAQPVAVSTAPSPVALAPSPPSLTTTPVQLPQAQDPQPSGGPCADPAGERIRAKALEQLLADLERDRNLVLHLEAAPRQGLAQLSYLDARERGEVLKCVEAVDFGKLAMASSDGIPAAAD